MDALASVRPRVVFLSPNLSILLITHQDEIELCTNRIFFCGNVNIAQALITSLRSVMNFVMI